MFKRTHSSAVTVPIFYLFSAVVLISFTKESIYSIYDEEINDALYFTLLSLGISHLIYAVLIRKIYLFSIELYSRFYLNFIFFEMIHLILSVFIFYYYPKETIAISILIHFCFISLYLYERKILK